jgi:hypothetical protein
MALGAEASAVRRSVTREAVVLVSANVAAGLLATLATTRFLEGNSASATAASGLFIGSEAPKARNRSSLAVGLAN